MALRLMSLRAQLRGTLSPDEARKTVFDAGRLKSINGAVAIGLSASCGFGSASMFRRSAADAEPARSCVTGAVMGDPAPGRFNHKPLWKPAEREPRY